MKRKYDHLGEIFIDLAVVLKPAEELTVAEAAEKYRKLNNAGSFVGDWKNSTTPEMVEPMNTFDSREHSGLIYVGPAQSGKTDSLVINTLAYRIKVDPMDVMLVCPTHADGRDFSMRRIDRLHLHSPDIGAMLHSSSDSDNKFDKHYSNGMLFSIAWPTVSQLAGKPIPCVILTDRDRMPDDIDGDGEPFDLAEKRTTTFGSYAMCVAESSPSRPITDSKWIARTNHEAPPCEGILKLYNRGDRRRWNWPCPNCHQYFEGLFDLLEWDNDMRGTNLEKSETVRMRCPHCNFKIHPDQRDEMRQWGVWLKDGQYFDELGRVRGTSPRTKIASFWQRGVAAGFTTWRKLVNNYLDATDEYQRTGSEEGLKKFYNTDLAEPYIPQSSLGVIRTPEALQARAEHGQTKGHVPEGVRFLIALVDVQSNHWVVQVIGVMPGKRFEMTLVDRFEIRKSKRKDHDGDAELVDPAKYIADWDLITEQVIEAEYPLDDGSGRKMAVRFTGCDSGGKKGVTTMAYDYYRRLRTQGKHRRFTLIKGESTPSAPRARIGYPDSGRKGSMAGARGDIPVLMLHSNILKDDLDNRLGCQIPGDGMIHLPDYTPENVFSELCVETRGTKGWVAVQGARNEAWDLFYYAIGLCVSEYLSIENIDWSRAPAWAGEWDVNNLISKLEAPPRFAVPVESSYDFAALGKALA